MFHLPPEMLFEIYEFDSFKYDVWNKVNDQFLKGGYNRARNKIQTSIYIKRQACCCRRYCRTGKRIDEVVDRHVEVKIWLKNIKLFETTNKAL